MLPRIKRLSSFSGLSLLLLVSACSHAASFEREAAIEKSMNEFHARLNEEQYQAIYAEADPQLRNQIGEQEFTRRLAEARARAGKIEGKANVVLKSSIGRKLRKLFSESEQVSHFEITKCEAGSAYERFEWSLVDGTARLRDYELRRILERGKVYGFGNGNVGIAPK